MAFDASSSIRLTLNHSYDTHYVRINVFDRNYSFTAYHNVFYKQSLFKLTIGSLADIAEVHVAHVLEVGHVAVGALLADVVVPAVHEKKSPKLISSIHILARKNETLTLNSL